MSPITWQGNRLIQQVASRGMEEELGCVDLDASSGKYVLWLKDTRNAFAVNSGYIRGDEFDSINDAKRNAAGSVSANLMHHMWMARDAQLPVSVPEAKTIVIQTVENMQVNQNSLGIQISNSDVEKVKEEVEQAEPSLLAKIFKEWLPGACTSLGLNKLFELLSSWKG